MFNLEVFNDVLAPRFGQALRKFSVLSDSLDCLGKLLRIIGLDEQARLTIDDQVGNSNEPG